MRGALRKSSVTNRTNKAGRKREQKIRQTNHLSFLLAIPRPLFETQGRGSRELNKSHRGAKTGCKDKKGCKDKRGRFLGVVLCPPMDPGSVGLICNSCSSVFPATPPRLLSLLITVVVSFHSSSLMIALIITNTLLVGKSNMEG